ncbi:MAG: hypothetical protein HUJ56_11845 [Erysipelotrichaceae bacterium]|nr:hypothetical protein [Erysipelotrichaceae bacterium]
MSELKTSKASVVGFDKRSCAEMYNKHESVGLSIIRPNRKEIMLNNITKNNITVFYPFIRECEEYDEPESVSIEYLYSTEQTITINK